MYSCRNVWWKKKPPRCAWRNGRGARSPTSRVRGPVSAGSCLSPQERARQAGGAAAAVDAEFAAGEGVDVEAGGAQAGVGFAVLFNGQQALAAEREDVAGQRVALGGVDLDE